MNNEDKILVENIQRLQEMDDQYGDIVDKAVTWDDLRKRVGKGPFTVWQEGHVNEPYDDVYEVLEVSSVALKLVRHDHAGRREPWVHKLHGESWDSPASLNSADDYMFFDEADSDAYAQWCADEYNREMNS